jgi:release factor glutamine methyltransferase
MTFDPAQVYAPAEDTALLLDAAWCEVRPTDRVIEVGTGSGIIAAALATIAGSVVATDINPHAVACARYMGIDPVQCDLVSGIRGMFDLIIFNPPYLPTQPGERINDWLEYALDGGTTGRVVIERFVLDVGRVLAPGGRVLLLFSSLTELTDVSTLFLDHGYSVAVVADQNVEDEILYVVKITRLVQRW